MRHCEERTVVKDEQGPRKMKRSRDLRFYPKRIELRMDVPKWVGFAEVSWPSLWAFHSKQWKYTALSFRPWRLSPDLVRRLDSFVTVEGQILAHSPPRDGSRPAAGRSMIFVNRSVIFRYRDEVYLKPLYQPDVVIVAKNIIAEACVSMVRNHKCFKFLPPSHSQTGQMQYRQYVEYFSC